MFRRIRFCEHTEVAFTEVVEDTVVSAVVVEGVVVLVVVVVLTVVIIVEVESSSRGGAALSEVPVPFIGASIQHRILVGHSTSSRTS